MGYYDWEKIVAEKSDKELLQIYKERDREPDEKVNAVFLELKKRLFRILAFACAPANPKETIPGIYNPLFILSIIA